MQPTESVPNASTFVTGGTGFVGGELIVQLLTMSSRKIMCLVRADNEAHAVERGNRRLAELVGATDAANYVDRVEWIPGDLHRDHLGLTPSRWAEIAGRVNEVFHCAASVTFDLPIDEAHAINVEGTKRVHELAVAAAATHGRFRRFHQVSTAYAAGLAKGVVDPYYLPTDTEASFRNTYERTKARAERWLHDVASTDVPVTIHRPSIIAGNTTTGVTTNWNVLYVPMRMIALGALPVFARGGRQSVDCVGVDFVARSIVAFAAVDAAPLVAHHLTAGDSAVTTTFVMERTAELAEQAGLSPSKIKMLSTRQFSVLIASVRMVASVPKDIAAKLRLGRARSKCRLALRSLDKCGVYLPYSRVDTIFSTGDDAVMLGELGIEMPPGAVFFDRVCRYALDANFGKSPKVPVDVRVPVEAELAIAR